MHHEIAVVAVIIAVVHTHGIHRHLITDNQHTILAMLIQRNILILLFVIFQWFEHVTPWLIIALFFAHAEWYIITIVRLE